jgi:hypothetical protein
MILLAQKLLNNSRKKFIKETVYLLKKKKPKPKPKPKQKQRKLEKDLKMRIKNLYLHGRIGQMIVHGIKVSKQMISNWI